MTGLLDEFPALSKSRWRVLGFRFAVCMSGFLLGLPMTTRVSKKKNHFFSRKILCELKKIPVLFVDDKYNLVIYLGR